MPLQIEIKGTEITSKTFQKRAGGTGTIFEQVGWLDLPSGERRRVVVNPPGEREPYPVGLYVISDESFYVDQFGGIGISRLKLIKVEAAKVRAA